MTSGPWLYSSSNELEATREMTTWKPHLTVRALQPVVAGLEALGQPFESILAEASIPVDVLEGDPEGRVPHEAMRKFWELAPEITGDDHLGIHLAEAAPIGSFEVHAYALLSSPTLRDAYQRACRYQRLIHEATDLSLEEGDEEGVLRHALPGGLAVARQPAEFLVTAWVRFGRLITGQDWLPSRVCFAHAAAADISEHQRIFGDTVLFSSGRTAMHVSNSILDVENARADENLVRMMDRYAETTLQWVPSRTTLQGRVRERLVEALSSGAPTAAQVAGALNMSVRTLHRGLRQEGTGFRELLEQLRRERAADLLANRQCSIAEIAFLVGFSELSAFYRAFKRWTGKTPVEFRAEAGAAR